MKCTNNIYVKNIIKMERVRLERDRLMNIQVTGDDMILLYPVVFYNRKGRWEFFFKFLMMKRLERRYSIEECYIYWNVRIRLLL